jgi:hypothetical protein
LPMDLQFRFQLKRMQMLDWSDHIDFICNLTLFY